MFSVIESVFFTVLTYKHYERKASFIHEGDYMDTEIKISVCCLAYNHEKYIRETIEGILMQKTSFRYEVLINDDASTDETTKIIKEYEQKYPEIIIGLYHKENQYSLGKHVFLEQFSKSRGKYIFTCECDDYWVNEKKLQRQFEIMESNPDVSLCTHQVRHVEENGIPQQVVQPNFIDREGIISGSEFIKLMLTRKEQSIFHYSSYCFRKKHVLELVNNTPDFFWAAPVGDIFLQLFLGHYGNIYYIPCEMSHYRRNSINSWTLNNKSKEKKIVHLVKMIESYRLFDEYTEMRYTTVINDYIKELEFQICLVENDFKGILLDKERFNAMPIKKKFRVFLCCYFPVLEKLYYYFRNKKG